MTLLSQSFYFYGYRKCAIINPTVHFNCNLRCNFNANKASFFGVIKDCILALKGENITNIATVSALPAGNANGSNVNNVGNNANFWSASANDGNNAWNRNLNNNNADFNRNNNNKNNGFSVRCLRYLSISKVII